MTDSNSIYFKPRRSFRRIWIMIAGFGIFIPIGLVLFFTTSEKAALFAAAFGALPVLYMLFRAIAPGSRYEAGPDGLFLKNGSSSRLVPFHEIRGTAVLNDEQAKSVLAKYMTPAVESERERDMKEWLASSRAYGNFTRFCTVPIVQEYTSKGSTRNIVKYGTRLEGGFLILKLTSGEEFLLSPEDCGGLFSAIAARSRLSDTAPDTSFTWTADVGRRKKLRRFFTWYTRIALAAVLLAGAGIFLYSTRSAPVDTEGEWIDEDTFRYTVRGEIEAAVKDPDARQTELTEAVRAAVRPALISQLAGWYSSSKGIEPGGEAYDALYDILDSVVLRSDPVLELGPLDEETRGITVRMEYSGPELRQRLKEIMDEALSGTR